MELENVARAIGVGISGKSVYNRLQSLIRSNLSQKMLQGAL